jgi:ferrous iron transport protein A
VNGFALNKLGVGKSAKVIDIFCADTMKRRLNDFGLLEGTDIRCLQKSPAGDPVAYLIRGAVIALRSDDTNKIIVG